MKFSYLINTIFAPKKKQHLNFKTFGNVNSKDLPRGADPNLSYTGITSNNIKLTGFFIFDYFTISASDSNNSILRFICLNGHLDKNKGTNYFYLVGLKNEMEEEENLVHGIGCLMLQMLLNFIADYNEMHDDNEQIKYISGSINPIATHNSGKSEIELQKYYSKRSGLTDTKNRIKIVIDHDKCKNNDLYYDIRYVSNQE